MLVTKEKITSPSAERKRKRIVMEIFEDRINNLKNMFDTVPSSCLQPKIKPHTEKFSEHMN